MNCECAHSFNKKTEAMSKKKQNKELDVDFIQSRPLTKEEEKGLSEFIKKLKEKDKKSSLRKVA